MADETRGETLTLDGASPAPRAKTVAGDLGGRYRDAGRIGHGGMGEVRRVWDAVLERHLAMKLLDPRLLDVEQARQRFLNEARVTAGLQHPGIVAVHDQGRRLDGMLWYTMKEVRGRTLAAAIAEVHAAVDGGAWQPAPSGWTLRRLVEAFGRVCEAMAYAHAEGVIHRDLKPSNLMVGAFGEVLVMDWGLACRAGEAPPVGAASGPPDDDRLTRFGDVLGTVAYMPPEQARGDLAALGPASDVYALGAVLFEILVGRPPITDQGTGLRQLVQGQPPSIDAVARPAGAPPLDAELVALCRTAMAAAQRDRFADAGGLADAVRAWLDGARRRAQALAVVARAVAMRPRGEGLRAQAADLRAEARRLLEAVPGYAPEEAKAAGWALEAQAEEAEVAARLADIELVQTLQSALEIAPGLAAARRELADHHRARLVEAEARRDAPGVAEEAALLAGYDDGTHAAWLRGDGVLSLATDPPGASAEISLYSLMNRRMTAGPPRPLGATPLVDVVLPMGSYRLTLVGADRAPTTYPVHLGRQARWVAPEPVPLPPALAPDEAYVPAGWFLFGGDAAATDPLPRRRVWLAGFVVKRRPVTNAEYAAFLRDRLATDGEAAARPLLPADGLGPAGEATRWTLDDAVHAPAVEPADWPVVGIDWHAATAYAAWLATHTGLPWRLPHECEWEKAARGVDGRCFPWGDHVDPSWACMFDSRPGNASRSPVGAFAADESPYGVRDTAGNVREWCRNAYRRAGPVDEAGHLLPDDDPGAGFRVAKGGAWSSTRQACRAAGRFGARPGDRFNSLGLRVARPWPVGGQSSP